jgi:hypothetical protein
MKIRLRVLSITEAMKESEHAPQEVKCIATTVHLHVDKVIMDLQRYITAQRKVGYSYTCNRIYMGKKIVCVQSNRV